MSDQPLVHVIDDDEAVRTSLQFLLECTSISTRAYASAIAFLDLRPVPAAGCIVTDIRMPEMNGVELLRHLREIGCSLPVIMITGAGDAPLAIEALRAGAFDFIEKPFDAEALILGNSLGS